MPRKESFSKGDFKKDLDLARRMASRDSKVREQAWTEFYEAYTNQVRYLIRKAYNETFSDNEAEEVYDRVIDRLLKDDYKTLREYAGRCSLIYYLIRGPIRWECIERYKRRRGVVPESIEANKEETGKELEDPRGGEGEGWIALFDAKTAVGRSQELAVPIAELDQEQRWAFLLRYHNYYNVSNKYRHIIKKSLYFLPKPQ